MKVSFVLCVDNPEEDLLDECWIS